MLLNDSPAEQSSQAPSPTRLRRDEPKVASGKIAAFQYLAVIVFLYVLSGFWVLQVRESESYTERADANRIKSRPVLAPRGKILDRNGRVIVDNRESFSLVLARESLKEEHLKPISEGLNLDYE